MTFQHPLTRKAFRCDFDVGLRTWSSEVACGHHFVEVVELGQRVIVRVVVAADESHSLVHSPLAFVVVG